MRRNIHRLRTQTFGGGHRHRRMQAEATGRVRGGANDRARAVPSYDYRQIFQVRLFAQFDRGVERVHIDVDDFARFHGRMPV